MAPEYNEILETVDVTLRPFGFYLSQNDSYLAVFLSPRGVVILEGEPYVRGAFNLEFAIDWPTAPANIFSVRLLMQVFNNFEKPSLTNQLQFVVTEIDNLVGHPEMYRYAYALLNDPFSREC